MSDEGVYAKLEDRAKRAWRFLRKPVLRLTLLAPDLIEAM